MILVPHNKKFTAKKLCPYCGADLTLSVIEWEKDGDHWKALNIDVECVTIPDVESEAWDDWSAQHSVMPYVHWHPVIEKLTASLNKKYRFKMN